MDYSLIIKVTNNCNLNCSYCYHRKDSNRNIYSYMTHETIETMIKNILRNNDDHAEFIWHGGEPLLMGLDCFRFIVNCEKKYNEKGIKIKNTVQTNATLLDDEYIQFFLENDMHIGVSIDGPFDMHSLNRKTTLSEYENILNSLKILGGEHIKYGILCVVGNQHIGQAKRFFELLKVYGIHNISFLPCLVQENGIIDKELTISPNDYAQFLIDFFEIWIHGDIHGMSVRNFDDCIRFFRGHPAKTCIHLNNCDSYLTIVPNGDIYLCDNFSSSAEHRVGNVNSGFSGIETTDAMSWLKGMMGNVPDNCKKCKYYYACYSGCKYRRWIRDPSMRKGHYYCLSTHRVYNHIGKYFQ